MADYDRLRARPVVYTLPAMDVARLRRDLAYKHLRDAPLLADIYRPAQLDAAIPLPAVVFVHGDGPREMGQPKEWGQYRGWGQLAAASGLAGITFNHRSSEHMTRLDEAGGDVDDLIAWVRANAAALRVDGERLGVWACSAGVPYGMRAALRDDATPIRCAVAYYGFLDLRHLRADLPTEIADTTLREFSALAHLEETPRRLPPTLVAKAALDNPRINESIDRFVAAAERLGAPVEAHTHESGQHGFDLRDDDERSRAIIGRTLAFLRQHLAGA